MMMSSDWPTHTNFIIVCETVTLSTSLPPRDLG
jgi:hypothetical protein